MELVPHAVLPVTNSDNTEEIGRCDIAAARSHPTFEPDDNVTQNIVPFTVKPQKQIIGNYPLPPAPALTARPHCRQV
jgi:hypothetical protein